MNNAWRTLTATDVLKITCIGYIGVTLLMSFWLLIVFSVGGDIFVNDALWSEFVFDFSFVVKIFIGMIFSLLFSVVAFLVGRYIVNFVLKVSSMSDQAKT